MKPYESFRLEARRLQAIRVPHVVYSDRVTVEKAKQAQAKYWGYLSEEWKTLRRFCILKAKMENVAFVNSPDLARWGAYLPLYSVGSFYKSGMIPLGFILSLCADDDVDNKLREALCWKPSPKSQYAVQAISYFGYRPPDRRAKFETGSFHRLPGSENERMFDHLALVYLQHTQLAVLASLVDFFREIRALRLSRGTWTPLIVGLLKGSVDGFVLLGTEANGNSALQQELSALLSDRVELARHGHFWRNVNPILVYFGDASEHSVIRANLEMLPVFQPSGGNRRKGK